MKSETKNIVLLSGLILSLLLSYEFAVSPTLKLRREYHSLIQENLLYKNSPKQISVLLSQQKENDSMLQKMNLGSSSMENNLLRILNLQAEKRNIKIMDFNDPHIFDNNGSLVNTFDFTLQGDFTELLKTIYDIEQKNGLGEITNIHFKKQKDYRKNKELLISRILMRRIKY
ncbi:hypothetical protein [Spongiimicrobium sp. 3-5]|uniref:hypothetical protein n=1 Tax=Spongiimicrobium sp. 3-5 TaxID=3332596 RepID=UPI0039806BC7